jgi:ABC-type lipoprotein release transport system permease subunit
MLLRMAWRNVWRNPRRTAVVVIAVTVGIAGVLFCVAVNFGMAVQMVETAIRTELGHVQVHAIGHDANPELAVHLADGGAAVFAALKPLEAVRVWAPRVKAEGLVTSSRASAGVRIVGVDRQREVELTTVSASLTEGAFLAEARRVVIGEKLARRLGVEVGDKVVLSVTDLGGDLTGEAVRVGGLFRTASSVLDGSTIFLRIQETQKLLGLGAGITEVALLAHDRREVDGLRDALAAALPGHEVRSWAQMQPILVYLVEIFDQFALVMYVAVFVAMAFGIANVLLMTVYERVREIGIMMAIGMRRWRVATTIVVESVYLALIGVALGFGLGIGIVGAFSDGIQLEYFAAGLERYGVGNRIVPVLRPGDFVAPSLVALVTAIVASGWPALRATRFRPAEAVRHT